MKKTKDKVVTTHPASRVKKSVGEAVKELEAVLGEKTMVYGKWKLNEVHHEIPKPSVAIVIKFGDGKVSITLKNGSEILRAVLMHTLKKLIQEKLA